MVYLLRMDKQKKKTVIRKQGVKIEQLTEMSLTG